VTISRSKIPQQVSKGANKMMKKKGYKMGGKVKSKGMKKGGKVKAKGMKMGGKISPRKMMAKGMKMGGKVKTKGMKKGGAVGGMTLAKIRSAAKSKGYKLVKA
tara:strand:- start:566 stop:874 length:309 start_codon:yes stop_codon:yes gene_type:complete